MVSLASGMSSVHRTQTRDGPFACSERVGRTLPRLGGSLSPLLLVIVLVNGSPR
jgi:hypothetical protein